MNVPFYTEAISSLRPGCSWRLVGDDIIENLEWSDQNNFSPPTEEEVLEEAERLKLEYRNLEYQRQRAPEYPDLKELADALYWNSQGDTSKLEEYYSKCEKVKNKYPKPQ
jgi:hypothetical protein